VELVVQVTRTPLAGRLRLGLVGGDKCLEAGEGERPVPVLRALVAHHDRGAAARKMRPARMNDAEVLFWCCPPSPPARITICLIDVPVHQQAFERKLSRARTRPGADLGRPFGVLRRCASKETRAARAKRAASVRARKMSAETDHSRRMDLALDGYTPAALSLLGGEGGRRPACRAAPTGSTGRAGSRWWRPNPRRCPCDRRGSCIGRSPAGRPSWCCRPSSRCRWPRRRSRAEEY